MPRNVIEALATGKRVLVFDGDSAFGICGMEVAFICRNNLPLCVVVYGYIGIYRSDGDNWGGGGEPATTVFVADARSNKMMDAFGGDREGVRTSDEMCQTIIPALESGILALINAAIEPAAGKECGRIGNLRSLSAVAQARYPQACKE